ncbi:MAG: gfo/Idh/MocA family oxidoreductase, partial [Verrucomicrobiae bacterium]|nr:gfo/Idh/MocA family oxidoreductase [Verrucomicrobiae bacterium]
LHYDWHWVWSTGNGDIGNQGIHQMDIARWFLGEPALAPRVVSVGGRLGYIDDGQTPNTQIAFFDYPSAPLIFEVRGLPEKAGSDRMDKFMGASIGNVIHCENGYVVIADDNVVAYDNSHKEIKRWHGNNDHFANFIKAVRTRKHTDLTADILEGHISSALCHIANISYRLGRQAQPAEIRDAIKSEPDAEDTFQRMLDHLRLNEVDLAATPLTLGPVLRFNPRKEVFSGNPQANKLLTRNYRAPFVVPARV